MVSRAVERLREAIDELAASEVAGVSQRDDVVALWHELARLDAQFARRLAELERSAEWSVDGARSVAGWLVARTRASSGDAHHRVRVDALTSVRKTADAGAEFAVFEPALVDVARQGRPEDVANVGRQWRDALDSHLDRDGAERSEPEHDRRSVHFSRSLEGMGFLEGTFDVEGAEIIETALRRSYDRAHRAGDPRTPAQQRADAMVTIFSRYLDDQPRGANRPHLMLIGDAATVSGEAVGRCETLSGYRLAPETLRRLACDAIIQRVVLDSDGVVLNLGRATRTFTPDQYRAMAVRDGGCRWPGCDAGPDDCEAHHLDLWEHGGFTDVANGCLTCKRAGHHRKVHEGGWRVSGDPDGELTFHDPAGEPIGTSHPRRPPPPLPTRIGAEIELIRERVRELKRQRPPVRAA